MAALRVSRRLAHGEAFPLRQRVDLLRHALAWSKGSHKGGDITRRGGGIPRRIHPVQVRRS